ncbi:MAG: glycoside hydrolase family 3 N-terminal domain-containing protein [Thermoanaerobaculia bacterium]
MTHEQGTRREGRRATGGPLLFSASLLLAACASAPPATAPREAAPAAAAPARRAPSVASLSLREKAGQVVMVGSRGVYRAEDDPEYLDLARLVSEEGIGGVIWFLGTPLETADLNHRLNAKAKLPLLVAADLESGPGMRFPDLVFGPSAMAVAATGDLDLAERRARATAEAARALGIQVVFAPVADVNNNPDNPVINVRSFGEEPAAVGRFVAATVKGLQEGGVLATLKHFPGHGDTAVDSHRSLPVLSVDRARLDAVELVPFRAGLAAGARSVMTAHLAVPALDPTPVPVLEKPVRNPGFPEDVKEAEAKGTLPAVVSRAMTTKLLREEMGFSGLVFTDSMEMGGIVAHFETGEAAVRVLEAGGDVVLMPPDPRAAIAAIVAAVESGRLPESRLDEAVGRLLAEKERLGLFRGAEIPDEEVSRKAGTLAQKATEEEVARRGLTLVREAPGALPLRPDARLLAVAVHDERTAVAIDATLQGELKKRAASLDFVRLDPTSCAGEGATVAERAKGADAVLVALFVRPKSGRGTIEIPAEGKAAIAALLASGRPVVAVSFGSPYLLRDVPALPTFLCGYGPQALVQAAAARALYGEAAIEGRLPVTIPALAPRGTGLRREAVK